jgi:FkbM family methyltransferase
MFQTAAKLIIKELLNWQEGYRFYPAKSINKQEFLFEFRGKTLIVEADYTTPLYETIAEIVDHDCYQLAEMKWENSPNSVVLDIGANIGVSALVLSQLGVGHVACFEPIESNCKWIRSNLVLNNISNVSVTSVAITKHNGTTLLRVNPNESVSATGINVSETAFSPDLVRSKSISLHQALEPFADMSIELMKIDCEGGEYAIVDQITNNLAKRLRRLSFEVHDIDNVRNVKTLTKQLESLGFAVIYKEEMFKRRRLHHLLATQRL